MNTKEQLLDVVLEKIVNIQEAKNTLQISTNLQLLRMKFPKLSLSDQKEIKDYLENIIQQSNISKYSLMVSKIKDKIEEFSKKDEIIHKDENGNEVLEDKEKVLERLQTKLKESEEILSELLERKEQLVEGAIFDVLFDNTNDMSDLKKQTILEKKICKIKNIPYDTRYVKGKSNSM